jgi:4-hydroxy-tetrahydrodipicolinate reductase
MSTRIGIHGAAGRMGRRLMALACADDALTLAGAVDAADHPLQGKPVSEFEPEASGVELATRFADGLDAIIDFSATSATMLLLEALPKDGPALVIGTTGFDAGETDRIKAASANLPVVMAPNMSMGVNLLFRLAGEMARALGEDFDIEIVESHHNQKADAPSGTAMGLAKSIVEATDRSLEEDLVHGRSGKPGPRTKREIGMHALRLGSVVGDHTVHFGSEFERIELTHRAQSRDVFASGALAAAKWASGREPGLYSMQDVLFGG